RAAVAQGNELVWPDSLPDEASGEATDAPAIPWEQLLDREAVDAVIMGGVGDDDGDDDERLRRLAELMRQGQSVLTSHPLFKSVLAYYEIDMARGETGALLRHFNPLTCYPELQSATRECLSDASPLGPLEQISAVRYSRLRTPAEVTALFARDVEALEVVAGRLDRLGAHGAVADGDSYAGLAVQLTGRRGWPVRWNVAPPLDDATALELVLTCQQGRIGFTYGYDERLREVWRDAAGKRSVEPLSERSPADDAWKAFAQSAPSAGGLDSGPASSATWSHALHAMDLADAIEVSLRRGRMIDVHEQQLTEELAFKGTMAAVGCGLLVVTPPLMLGLGWIAGGLGLPVAAYWPHALLGILGAFLAFQTLPRLLLRGRADQRTSPAEFEATPRDASSHRS
ncbi:MAG: hypothetical protein KDA61_06370, partial [Planctomycetales bacterium]|nr:hypothetical protein [Planctomycetales bacterium]